MGFEADSGEAFNISASEPRPPSVVDHSLHSQSSGDVMASKRRVRKRPTGVSGLAATLLRDKIAPFDTPQSRKKFGELIAGGAVPSQNSSPPRGRKMKTPADPK
jgi:hypothetical protein